MGYREYSNTVTNNKNYTNINYEEHMKNTVFITFAAVITLIGVVAGLLFGVPVYRVWAANYNGRAILVKAEQTRQVLVTQANAELEASKARAQAIAIVGEAAQKYPEYRQQEFMGAFAEALREGTMSQIIYVPTEANIPVMEAGKRPIKD